MSEATSDGTRPRHVQVYGNDHSPWVQAVLLGLHQAGIAHDLVTAPPLPVFLESGVLMPAASIDGAGWQVDSARILAAVGYSDVDAPMRRALQRAFLSAAMYRTEDPWQFWHRFSYARDDHPSTGRHLWNHFWRAFPVFYFFMLISFGRWRTPPRGAEAIVADFGTLQDELAPGQRFLGGEAPDTADFQLFGLIQMCASIPGLPLEVLRESPRLERLRGWIEAMQTAFRDYGHLYTACVFEPKVAAPRTASALERGFYWVGAAVCWVAVPVTLPLTLFYAARVRRMARDSK